MIEDDTVPHVLRMAATKGWEAYAEYRARELEREEPEHYGGLLAAVLRVTGGPTREPRVYDESNAWAIPRNFGKSPDMRTNAQRRKA